MRIYQAISSLLVLVLLSCGNEEKESIDLSGIESEIELIRFDQLFYGKGPESLEALKTGYPYLFPGGNDSIWINKMQDEDELFLYKEVQKEFPDLKEAKTDLEGLFKHVKYYFPTFRDPKLITLISTVDYENRVIYADSLLLVSLDVYLGSEHPAYSDYPMYVKQNFKKSQIPVDVANSLAVPIVPRSSSGTFVSRMIQEGKRLKVIESFLPMADKASIIGYTAEQYQWATISEQDIWKYFVQNEMLYSTDSELHERFIADAPFSKFYLDVDRDSPGRIGAWFGWQIVNAYMKNSNSDLESLLKEDNETIFTASRYKPKKQ